MSEVRLNFKQLRNATGTGLVVYLDELRLSHSDSAICRALFEAVNRELIPSKIFHIVLGWTKDPDTIKLCMSEGPSPFIRMRGFKQFGKALAKTSRSQAVWDAVQGTTGLVELFGRISVTEVIYLASAIGGCGRGQPHEPRQAAIEELLRALVPSHYAALESVPQSRDKRPIQQHYGRMVAACSTKFVQNLLDEQDDSNPLYQGLSATKLIKTHGQLMRKRVYTVLFEKGSIHEDFAQSLTAFLYTEPPLPGPEPEISASMNFATRVLQMRLKRTEEEDMCWPSSVSEAHVLFSVLRRSLNRKLSDEKIRDVIGLGLRLLEQKPRLKADFHQGGLWSTILNRWKKEPEEYDSLLAKALRLGLGGTPKSIARDYLQASRQLNEKRNLRWKLLQSYCLNVPKKGLDPEKAQDFNSLAKQPWPIEVFNSLTHEQAILLLHGLQTANPEYNFLQAPGSTSILSSQSLKSQYNFNVVLLLTQLRCADPEIRKSAVGTVDELRKKAATAKEQADRALFAKAASSFAIASDDLELYAETVLWQQRFVRDPLTIKVIYARDAVLTTEGIILLSGIPKPIPKSFSLIKIASKVEKANGILLTLHETVRMAKREPSFQQHDWTSVASLFGEAINERVLRAKDIHEYLEGSEEDVYQAIWAGTLSLLEKVGAEFVNQAYRPISALLSTLRPSALATISKTMLDEGNVRRRKEDKGAADDSLERLSYVVLLQLAKSDKPELAQQLVLQTILDRPEASSWHRQLLSISFMKSLSAQDAQKLLLAFATAIGEKLEEQSYVKVGEPQPTPSQPPRSLVKVTTVKYLAQLLENAEFLSADAAVEVLVELFKAGTHRDIRLATLDSLLSLLNTICGTTKEEWRSNHLVGQILKALDTVVPVVGSINERRPLRPEAWVEAKDTGTIPEIPDVASAGMPPLLNAIITAASGVQYPNLKILKTDYISRFIIPILVQSRAEHQEWVLLFLRKYNRNTMIPGLPPTPVTPQIWSTVLAYYPELLPRSLLREYEQYIVMTIDPPPALARFNKTLQQKPETRNTPEVQHWLFVYGKKFDRYTSSATHTFVSMIHHKLYKPIVADGITFDILLNAIETHASLFLQQYEQCSDVWREFVADLRHPNKSTIPAVGVPELSQMVTVWEKSGRIVLKKVLLILDEARRKQKRDEGSTSLPSATKLRLWLLPYPSFSASEDLDLDCRNFATELKALLEDLLQGETNVLRWPKILEDCCTISQLLNTNEERLCVALHVGTLQASRSGEGGQKTLASNLVCVSLAMNLIDAGRPALKRPVLGEKPIQQNLLTQSLRKMAKGWQSVTDEIVRDKTAEWKKDQKGLWEILMASD